jgi:phosphate uptake regulator
MDELRKVQKVGYSTLAVSIPKRFAKEMNLSEGDGILFREDADGTLRLIPETNASKSSKVTIRADLIGDDETLTRLIVGSYALGYDAIEVYTKEPLNKARVSSVIETVKKLRGLEVVESDGRHVVAQSFIDPTKFPVDSLVKRLQALVAKSLDDVMEALDLKKTESLDEVRRVQEEIDELYWLIVRQLLVALTRRELAADIGIESPLHASGDRVCAKTLNEIGGITLDIAEELIRLKVQGTEMDPRVVRDIRRLGAKAGEAFNTTVESLLTSDLRLIGSSAALVEDTLKMEKEITHEMLESGKYGYARVLASLLAQLARYCNIIIEIASHRLLRKSSRIVTIQR